MAIATIGDVVAIKGENRAIVQFGLNLIKNTDNMGLRALMEISGINPETITSSQVAFGIVPRINAAGRMGKTQVAINLLLSESETEANQYADELNKLNVMRQQAELDILENIQISKEDLYNRLLVLQGDDWNAGVIGIVCSRLVEKYGKPTFILSGSDELTGSCRSVGGFHIFNALSYCAKYLKKYGGHKAAGGFSLERSDFKRFKNALETYAYENFDIMPCPYIKVDKIITLKELTIDNVKSLELLQPFGCENEEPLFLLENATIEKIVPLSAGKHIKLMLKQAELSVQALYFNMTAENLPAVFGDRVDVLFNASINEYNGEKSVCLKIKDIRKSSFNQDKFFAAKAYFEKIIRQEEISQNIIKASIPTREEIAVCYRFLLKGFSGSDEILYQKLLDSNINFCKLKIIIEVLTEMELINDDFSVIKTDKKVDLQQSKLLVRLRELI
ncbi:MAG: DHHA1 domain-containing protein [Oscillospiraceae bacterium]